MEEVIKNLMETIEAQNKSISHINETVGLLADTLREHMENHPTQENNPKQTK